MDEFVFVDGIHQPGEEFIYFILPKGRHVPMLFGVSCYQQIETKVIERGRWILSSVI
jgi:hypothetical protein